MRTLFRKLGQVGWSFPIILALLALCIASIFAITSATYGNDALKDAPATQLKYIIAGFVVYLAVALTPYRTLVGISPILYAIGVCLLIACFIPHLGRNGHGANSWLKIGPLGFEPAEFAKLAYILGMAWFLRVRENQIQDLSTVVMALVITAVPFVLILKQPALGSASVFFPICFAMLFAAGARAHYLAIPLIMVASLTVLTYYWVHVWDKPVPFLKPFQVFRIKVFFDPSLDPKGAGWQVDQSMIAIGSGGWEGKGWRQGVETELGYLPKNTSYNDLIFPVVAEDFGFPGAAALIIGEGIVLLWCWWVAARARDKIGALVAVGVMTMLFTHTFVNIGMTIQLVPITGIPLPFVSYGGTFLVACLAAMGLVQSVWVHRKNFERT
ncbi:MAG: rod shape-determining protein RodA [Methylacidiphilales bacterium]|nr:rod shape-determining protein RodA [Candidatus Methylacidiphilales bacterium]